jgi:hypothetical protein
MGAWSAQGNQTRSDIVTAMVRYEDQYGMSPSLEQIAQLARPGRPMSRGLVWYHLQRLLAEGVVSHTIGQCRTYRVVRPEPNGQRGLGSPSRLHVSPAGGASGPTGVGYPVPGWTPPR